MNIYPPAIPHSEIKRVNYNKRTWGIKRTNQYNNKRVNERARTKITLSPGDIGHG